MTRPSTFNRAPDGFIITVDGHVVAEAGKHGVIKDEDVTRRIKDGLAEANTEAAIFMFAVFTLPKEKS